MAFHAPLDSLYSQTMIHLFPQPGARTDDPDRTITDSSVRDGPSDRQLPPVTPSHLLPSEFNYLNTLLPTSTTLPHMVLAKICVGLVRREAQSFNEARLERLVGLCYGGLNSDDEADSDWKAVEPHWLDPRRCDSLRVELFHALKAFWEKERVQRSVDVVSRPKAVIPQFDHIRPGDTQLLLSSYAPVQRKPVIMREGPIAREDFEIFKFGESMEIGEELPWAQRDFSMGRLLSVSGAGDLSEATDIHLIHANLQGCKQIRVPPSGDVILVVTPTEYLSLSHDLFEGAQRQHRIRLLVMNEDNASEVCRRLHTLQWVVEILSGATGIKRFHMLEGNVKTVHGERLPMGLPDDNTIEAMALHSGISKRPRIGDLRCAVWHIAQPERARIALQFAQQALRFLPADFDGAPSFLHFCLATAEMKFGTMVASPLTWEAEQLRSPQNLMRVASFEKTYGDPGRLKTIQGEIQGCDKLLEPAKTEISALYQSFFEPKIQKYEVLLKETQQKVSALSESVVDTSRVEKLKTRLAASTIRQGLYDAMNRFMVSPSHRILFVEAPCGVGKTLALSMLSAERRGQGAWFSFPTNMLAKQFVDEAPRKLVSVHCEGDVKGADLSKLEKHATGIHNAVFVHPTLLNAIRPEGDLNRFNELTVFVDEWHNLGDTQLKELLASLKATQVKLVLLSATPREAQWKSLMESFPEACQQHVISVDSAIQERLLRPRLVFDATDTSLRGSYCDSLAEAIGSGAWRFGGKAALPKKPKTEETPFDLRCERAMATLDFTIDGQALWERSGVIYLNNIKNAQKICDDLREKYPSLSVFNATGDHPEVPDFTARPFALVCCKRFKEGANIPALGYVMTLAAVTDTDAVQIGGRLSRRSERPDELPFGLFIALGDGSSEQEILRSDRVGEDQRDLEEFLKRCRTRDGQDWTRHLPLVPAKEDIFFGDPSSLQIRVDLKLLERTKANRTNSISGMLGHKRQRSDESVS